MPTKTSITHLSVFSNVTFGRFIMFLYAFSVCVCTFCFVYCSPCHGQSQMYSLSCGSHVALFSTSSLFLNQWHCERHYYSVDLVRCVKLTTESIKASYMCMCMGCTKQANLHGNCGCFYPFHIFFVVYA